MSNTPIPPYGTPRFAASRNVDTTSPPSHPLPDSKHVRGYSGDSSLFSVPSVATQSRSFITSTTATAQQLPHLPWSRTVPSTSAHFGNATRESKLRGRSTDSGSNPSRRVRVIPASPLVPKPHTGSACFDEVSCVDEDSSCVSGESR